MKGDNLLVRVIVWTVLTGFGLLLALGYYESNVDSMEYEQPPFTLQLEDASLELVESVDDEYGERGLYLLSMTITNTSNVTDTFADYLFVGELEGCSVYTTQWDDREYLLDHLALLPAGQTSRVELLLEISSYEGPLPTEGTMQLSWMDWDKEEEQPLGSVELSG